MRTGGDQFERANEHWRLLIVQLLQEGCVSSHFVCRCLHSLQPNRDLRCELRIASQEIRKPALLARFPVI
jgi:hypothetical protein